MQTTGKSVWRRTWKLFSCINTIEVENSENETVFVITNHWCVLGSLCYLCCHSMLPLKLWICVFFVMCLSWSVGSFSCEFYHSYIFSEENVVWNAIAPIRIWWWWCGGTVCSTRWNAYILCQFSFQTLWEKKEQWVFDFFFVTWHRSSSGDLIKEQCLYFSPGPEIKYVRPLEVAWGIFRFIYSWKGSHFGNI